MGETDNRKEKILIIKKKRVGLKKNKKMNYIGKAWKASVSE